jgi:diaminopropionate ammonia-lyase
MSRGSPTDLPVSGAVVNAAVDRVRVPRTRADAMAFHKALPGYAPTPLHELSTIAAELGVGAVLLKDESNRLGLPAFKILGASWAIERTLREAPDTRTLVTASTGNHGRAVARVAATRGLDCRIFLPARSLSTRREAIAAEGAEVVVIDGDYEDAVAAAGAAGAEPGVRLIADVGDSAPAHWVIDGYATLFAETADQTAYDLVIVPVGVGALAAAAARHGAERGIPVIAVEPVTAPCLAASLAAGRPVAVASPGTIMAGLDCPDVSVAAWSSLHWGVDGAITVDDAAATEAMAELDRVGLRIGECGAATLAALRRLMTDPACASLRAAVGAGTTTAALLIGTDGRTSDAPVDKR